ncbi:MAG: hypothetical protein U0796_14170 [Gemmatales bacterium]
MKLITFLMMFLCSVSVAAQEKVEVQHKVTDQNGRQRLSSFSTVKQEKLGDREVTSFDFHSLVWEESDDKSWKRKIIISKEDLEKDGRERWVVGLHSLNAQEGKAVLKIGEKSEPDKDGTIRAIYSWCEWDLRKNTKLKTIKVCKDPFEALENKPEVVRSGLRDTPMFKLLKEAEEHTRNGKYAEALQKHIYFHENALKTEPWMAGVRLSFALSSWARLGEKYPQAREALVALRDRHQVAIEAGKANHDVVSEVISINTALNESDRNVTLFKKLDAQSPKKAGQYYDIVERDLIANQEYALCSKYLKNPMGKLNLLIWARSMSSGVMKDSPDMLDVGNQLFTQDTCQLLRILLATDRITEAKQIRDKALTVINTPEMRKTLDDLLESKPGK